MSKNLTPLGEFVLLYHIRPEDTSKGGIVIHTAGSTSTYVGLVLKKGPDVTGNIQVGDVVMWRPGLGIEVPEPQTLVLVELIPEEHIMAILGETGREVLPSDIAKKKITGGL